MSVWGCFWVLGSGETSWPMFLSPMWKYCVCVSLYDLMCALSLCVDEIS